jgi:RNA ligase (TIGR02306 family)
MTVYHRDGEFGVCSRNFDLIETDTNAFWQCVRDNDIKAKMIAYGRNIAVQGELVGPGVQGNKYNLSELRFYVFNVYDIENKVYMGPKERYDVCRDLDLLHVPVVYSSWWMKPGDTVDLYLEKADGQSIVNPKTAREGLVWKCYEDPSQSFKAISNKWLLKNE